MGVNLFQYKTDAEIETVVITYFLYKAFCGGIALFYILRKLFLQIPIVDNFDVACRVLKITRINNVFFPNRSLNPK